MIDRPGTDMVTILPQAALGPLTLRLEGVIAMLGFDQSRGLVRRWADYRATSSRQIVRQAFDTIRVHAVFGFLCGRNDAPKFSPILYLTFAEDDACAAGIYRLVWSQGVVPILLVATPAGLQIRRSLNPATARPVSVAWDRLANPAVLPPELTSLTAIALSSSIVWRDFVTDRSIRVDAALLKAIETLNDTVCREHPALRQKSALVNALIGRFIYFFILLDRRMVNQGWIATLTDEAGKALCPQIAAAIDEKGGIDIADRPWPAREVWALFDKIDDILNGAIFPITEVERRLIPSGALHLVRRAIRHGDTLGRSGHQLGFLDVSFATLRTQTISAIYELFLLIEGPEDKDGDGAFYTPPFLVQLCFGRGRPHSPLYQQVLHRRSGGGLGNIFSGRLRRILEREMPQRDWAAVDFHKARIILETAIFGIEKNRQAANVTRFSLYLTLLDYIENASIAELKYLAGSFRVFPALDANVLDRDLFSMTAAELVGLALFPRRWQPALEQLRREFRLR